MRVLHLGKFYPPARGGMETILELICERTSGAVENRVLVASHDGTAGVDRRGRVEVVRVKPLVKVGAVAFCPGLPWQLRKERADVIVIHEPNPMGLLAYFLARPAGHLIVWFHSEVIRPGWKYRIFYRPLLDFALARAARIIVASPTLAASSVQLRAWQSKCIVIPYGVAPRREPSSDWVAERAEEIRRQFGKPLVLFVGRLVGYKGVEVLIEAMRGISGVALIAGNGPLRVSLEQAVASAGVGDRVKFLGEVRDVELEALYRACDLFVLPSVTRQEAFGVVQIEAMSHGKPVVSTDLGTGVGWVNQDGETGRVVPPRDAGALRDAIADLLSRPTTLVAMGSAARKRARTMFSVDRMIDATLELYRHVMGEAIERKTVA